MTDYKKAVHRLQIGDLVVYPTDTLYALGANIEREQAVRKLYIVKRRPIDYPVPIAVADIESIDSVAIMNKMAWRLARAFLPGPLTLVLKKRETISNLISRDTVAVRVPNHPVAIKLIQMVGPLTATSANKHSSPPPSSIAQAREQLGNQVACYLDCGSLSGIPSTIVEVTTGLSVLREGAIDTQEVYAFEN